MAGIRTPQPIAELQREMPEVYEQLTTSAQLEQHYREMQDIEFTIERGKLWMLQTRDRQAHRRGGGSRSPGTWWRRDR